jgi:zinc/manganese transport system substrate-binding protein
MRRLLVLTLFLAVAWAMLGASAAEAQKLRIVTSTTDLKAITEVVNGDLAEVDAMTRQKQNTHNLEVRHTHHGQGAPGRRHDRQRPELDNWPTWSPGANNQNVIPERPAASTPSRALASRSAQDPRGPLHGDVPPQGNPHYTLDPGMAPAITQNILEGPARIAPQHRAAFERNRQQFLARLEEALGRWNQTLEPYKGAPVVVGHAMWVYLLTRFGLVQVGTIEERPGIPPTANHLAKLINLMKEDKVKVIVAEPWSDLKLIERVAQDAGAQTALLASSVGAVKGTDTFI